MATIVLQDTALTGLEETFAAASVAGDVFVNDGKTLLHVVNGGGAPITVTVDSQVACNQGADHNAVTTVTNAEERYIGPFPIARFNNALGQCAVTYSDVTTVTVAAIRLV